MSLWSLLRKPAGRPPGGTIAAAGGSEFAKTADDRRLPIAAGIPMGSVIPRWIVEDPHLAVLNRPTTAAAERFRRIRLKLEQPGDDAGRLRQVFVVTSSAPGEGKTTVAVNLALAMAEDRDRRTLLVDADLRHPSVAPYVSPQPSLGLSEVLAGEASIDHALVELRNTKLVILPAGRTAPNPLELFESGHVADLFAELRRRFDRIVIDTPPVVAFTEAAVLQTVADGTLLVVRAGKTTRPLLERAQDSLGGGLLLGVVLNDVTLTPVDRYYYRYDEHDPGYYSYGRREREP